MSSINLRCFNKFSTSADHLIPLNQAYRTSTLYGAAEQAVGGASAVAALSIASIIGPQVCQCRTLPLFWRL